MNHNPKRNASGCKDPTAYEALKTIIHHDNEVEKQTHKLIAAIKNIVELAGFELVGRIEIKHKKSGREFR